MSTPQQPTPPAAAGLVAHSAGEGVAFGAATFDAFVAAQVAQLPEEERAQALAWLTRLSELLAPAAPRA